MDEGELEKLAVDELLREAKRGRERAQDMGPAGWDKCPVPPANKRFLINTLASQLSDKKRKAQSEKKKSDNDGQPTSKASQSTDQKLVAVRSSSPGKSRTHHATDVSSSKKDKHRKSYSRSRSRDSHKRSESSKSRSSGRWSRSKSSEQAMSDRKKPSTSRSGHRSSRDRSRTHNKD